MGQDELPPVSDRERALYSDLFIVRQNFIDLFDSEKPLIEMGYTRKQIGIVKPVLMLIEGEGEIHHHKPGPELYFNGKSGSSAFIDRTKINQKIVGHCLTGALPFNRQSFWDLFSLGMDNSPVFELSEVIARVYCFNPIVDIGNVSILVNALYSESGWVDAPLAQGDRSINKIGRRLGLVTTYRAGWVDDRKTKLAVEIHNPRDNESMFHLWRVLKNMGNGSVYYVGQMPDVGRNTPEIVEKTLRKKVAFNGNLGLQGL